MLTNSIVHLAAAQFKHKPFFLPNRSHSAITPFFVTAVVATATPPSLTAEAPLHLAATLRLSAAAPPSPVRDEEQEKDPRPTTDLSSHDLEIRCECLLCLPMNSSSQLLIYFCGETIGVLGVVTAIWVLFELMEYHLLTLVCHTSIFALAVLFLWSSASTFINKSSPRIPEVKLAEEPFLQAASALRAEINYAFSVLRDVASGRDLKKFLASGVGAIKTVGLDATLGGQVVQYREMQGHETGRFLSYFNPCIIP